MEWSFGLRSLTSLQLGNFSHCDLEMQRRKGLTLIWPVEWTHANKGDVLKSDSNLDHYWMDALS